MGWFCCGCKKQLGVNAGHFLQLANLKAAGQKELPHPAWGRPKQKKKTGEKKELELRNQWEKQPQRKGPGWCCCSWKGQEGPGCVCTCAKHGYMHSTHAGSSTACFPICHCSHPPAAPVFNMGSPRGATSSSRPFLHLPHPQIPHLSVVGTCCYGDSPQRCDPCPVGSFTSVWPRDVILG